VLGGVRVGRGAKIGAMSLVLHDVPAGATAVGVPARIIERGPGPAGQEAQVTRDREPVGMASDD
jgi:serine O-acetyltransferase